MGNLFSGCAMPTFDDDPFFPQPRHHYNPSVSSSTTAFSDEPPSYDKTIESDKLNQEHSSQHRDDLDSDALKAAAPPRTTVAPSQATVPEFRRTPWVQRRRKIARSDSIDIDIAEDDMGIPKGNGTGSVASGTPPSDGTPPPPPRPTPGETKPDSDSEA